MKSGTCGCCELPPSTPLRADNRPGLSAIAFRAGTYSTFRLSMLQSIARAPALAALQTRRDDDYAITVFDLWATVADVLTFYQERIANEGFLRTARLRDSILRLARLLDYQLRPGVAANALLAFTLDKNKALRIPVGLRVQSVPAEGEKPQIYETLEAIAAESALNRVRVGPAPIGVNPLARGNTAALLAPGPEGLAAAAGLAPGDRFVLFETSQIEELVVRHLRFEEDRITLTWTGPVQGAGWDVQTEAYPVGRTFRIFGHNAPAQYMEATETPAGSGDMVWHLRTFSSYSYAPPAVGVIELDAKYEGIAAGSQLLIAQAKLVTRVTVTAVSQGQAKFQHPNAATTPFQDTVTLLTVSPLPAIADRRVVVIHEIKGPRIAFWGHRYPDAVAGSTVYIPARRIDAQTAEIGRVIQNNAYTPGIRISLRSIDTGRKVLLSDPAQAPKAAVVTGAALLGVDPVFLPTPGDPATALQLRLDPQSAQPVAGLVSAPLPSSLALRSAQPEISVTIGSLPPRTISLNGPVINPFGAAIFLQGGLLTSLPALPEITQSRVLLIGDRLVVLAGAPGVDVAITATPADATTAADLGFASPLSRRVSGLYSGVLASPPTLSNPKRQMVAAFGPIGPFLIKLDGVPTNPFHAASLLQSTLRAADPAPAFSDARVFAFGSRLLILPGLGGTVQDYLAVTLQPEAPFRLDAAATVLLGNVAQASHGETVAGEVLGDGDATVPFQKFELQKKPLTYTPSAGPGGRDSSLRVLVDDALWSEVPTLFGKGPNDQVYTTRIADDGTVALRFGDGRTGTRLPSGRGNVVARYRQGSGLQGRVAAGALKSPLDLPVGLKSVFNPLAATGGADPESLAQARQNAPTTVRTFGRAVSLRDFEDLAGSSGEVAKALATWVWNGEARAVHLTVAAQGGQLFTPGDLARIHASLDAQRDPNHALFLDNFVQTPIVVQATVRVHATHVAAKVAAAARAALLGALSFETLRFGQPLALSEIYSVLQQVPGVESVDIDRFQFKDQTPAFLASRGATADPVQRSLRIFPARPNPDPPPPAVLPAELAFVESPAEDIQIITSGGLPE